MTWRRTRLVELSYHTKINQRRLRTMSDKIIQLNEGVILQELKELARSSVEKTLKQFIGARSSRVN